MMKGKHCSICGKGSLLDTCEDCSFLLKQGASKKTIERMISDKETSATWAENKITAERLARAYYGPLLDSYGEKILKKKDKENFGFNTFADGITLGLDVIMPLLDDFHSKKAKKKISMMLSKREK